MYLVGKIIGTHGIKGELKVKSDSSFERFVKGNKLYIRKDGKDVPIVISSARVHKGNHLITINEITDINLVLGYVGCEIYTTHGDDGLSDDEFYIEDLVGLIVQTEEKEEVGKVVDVREVPQGFILEIDRKGKTVLIPFVNEFVKEVTDEVIIVNLIEGML